MTPCDRRAQIPAYCADKFEEVAARLGHIEAKIDHLCESQRTWGRRLWDISKAVVLLVVGWLWGLRK